MWRMHPIGISEARSARILSLYGLRLGKAIFFYWKGDLGLSKGEKLAVLLTALLLAAAVVFLCTWESGAGRYSLSAMPEPTPAPTPVPTPLLVDLNTATAQELDQLPGIGEVLSERIVAYRTENGPFQTIEEIMDVDGIGESVFADLSPYITVSPG